MNLRHITRFTYTYTNFQGWRVAINRQGTILARYFSDKQYGSEIAARDEAIRFRDMLMDEINQNPQRTREILDKYRVSPQNPYPAGLKPGKSEVNEESDKVTGCSFRSNQVMQRILRDLCSKLHLDTASVMKLSLYMFALQYSEQTARAGQILAAHANHNEAVVDMALPTAPSATLQRLISELEYYARQKGIPCFEEFSTGKTRYAGPPDEVSTHNASPPLTFMYTSSQTTPFSQQNLSSTTEETATFPTLPHLASSHQLPSATSSHQHHLFLTPAFNSLAEQAPI